MILVDEECVGVRDTEGCGVLLKLAGLAVRVRVRVRVAVAAIVPGIDIRSIHATTTVGKRMRMFQGAQKGSVRSWSLALVVRLCETVIGR